MKRFVMFLMIFVALVFAFQLDAIEIVPISEIKSGMKGYGLTVFRGTKPDTFQVEIYGMTYGPYFGASEKWPLIWAKMSGGPADYSVERIGPASGMSGSPIFSKDGRLIGALSCGPSRLDKDPVCGITPAEVMKNGKMAGKAVISSGEAKTIKTPLYIFGLDIKSFEFKGLESKFNPEEFVLVPVSGNSAVNADITNSTLQPGSSINVYLIRGEDLYIGANGTVTWIDSTGFYAFGHPFLGADEGNLEVAQAEVITTVANIMNSYKLSGGDIGKPIGSIQEGRFWGIRGEMGVAADVISTSVVFRNDEKKMRKVKCEVARLPDLSFYLIRVVAYNAIQKEFYGQKEPAERGSIIIETELVFKSGETLRLEQIYGYTGRSIYNPMVEFIGNFLNNLFNTLSDNDALAELKAVNFDVTFSKKREVIHLAQAKFKKPIACPGETTVLSLKFFNRDSLTTYETEVPFVIPPLAQVGKTVEVQVKTGIYLDGAFSHSKSDDTDDDKDDFSKKKELKLVLDGLKSRTNTSLFIKAIFPVYSSEKPKKKKAADSTKEKEMATTIVVDSTTKILVWKEKSRSRKVETKKSEATVFIKIKLPIEARIEANTTLRLKIKGNSKGTTTNRIQVKKSNGKKDFLVFGGMILFVLTFFTIAH